MRQNIRRSPISIVSSFPHEDVSLLEKNRKCVCAGVERC
uniref:Uncharacterized protein n=1 Tax=Rhizophora mucronata TaxID=61149 RepID=A0A2P2R059_RHIMU